jgi:hypothetical protein
MASYMPSQNSGKFDRLFRDLAADTGLDEWIIRAGFK